MTPEVERLDRARALVSLGTFPHGDFAGMDVISTALDRLGAELTMRVPPPGQMSDEIEARALSLASSVNYVSSRFRELVSRVQLIHSMTSRFASGPEPDAELWRHFCTLAIKDVHADVSSLMDGIAALAIAIGGGSFDPQGWVSHWGSISPDTGKSRELIPAALLGLTDSIHHRWWRDVKDIRDLLLHRPHDKIVFPGFQMLLFQVYGYKGGGLIIDPVFLWENGHQVVRFDLYSTFLVAEALVIVDQIGGAAARELGIGEAGLPGAWLVGNWRWLVTAIDSLKARVLGAAAESGEENS